MELLKRCDCREVTVLFDGDVAGLAAPAKAAQALFPAGLAGKVAILPTEGGKVDPDDYARAHGREGVEKVLAAAQPLSEFLIDRAVEKRCGAIPRTAALEAKLAAVEELAPLVRLVPEGLARTVFEDAIARKLDLDATALRKELAGARSRQPEPEGPLPDFAEDAPEDGPVGPRPDRRPRPISSAGAGARVRAVLPGPAADALGLLAAFPDLGPVAEEENLPDLLPAGPLSDLARDLIQGPVGLDAALARLATVADDATLRRVRTLAGPDGVKREQAARHLQEGLRHGRLAGRGGRAGPAQRPHRQARGHRSPTTCSSRPRWPPGGGRTCSGGSRGWTHRGDPTRRTARTVGRARGAGRH